MACPFSWRRWTDLSSDRRTRASPISILCCSSVLSALVLSGLWIVFWILLEWQTVAFRDAKPAGRRIDLVRLADRSFDLGGFVSSSVRICTIETRRAFRCTSLFLKSKKSIFYS